MNSRAVVIGGGIGGMATALLLARDGHQVTLIERGPDLGGRAGVLEDGGFRFDTGPSWYLMPEVFDHFFELCGTSTAEQLDLVNLDPGYRVFFEDGSRFDVAAGLERAQALFDSIEPGSGERLASYLSEAVDLYDLATERFLYSGFTSLRPYLKPDVLRRGPSMLGYLFRSLESHVAKRFTDPRLRQILGYPAVFLANAPHRTPSLYHIMSRLDLLDGVQYPMGGMRVLIDAVERLLRAAGVTVVTGAEAVAIEVAGGRARAVQVRADGEPERLRADLVIGACDLHHLQTRLLPARYRTRKWERRDPGMGALLLMVGVQGRIPGLQHHNLLFTRDWDANFRAIFGARTNLPEPASLYVCAPSVTDPGVAPPDHENLFMLVPIPADPALGPANGSKLKRFGDQMIAQLGQWSGTHDLRERIVVDHRLGPWEFTERYHAWSGTALGPAHTLRQSAFLRGGVADRRIPNLLYAGGFTAPGVGLPMCLISAENVLKHVRGDRSVGPIETGRAGVAPGPVGAGGDR